MKNVRFESFDTPLVTSEAKEHILRSVQTLHDGTGGGAQYLGWLDLPAQYDKAEYDRIQRAATRIGTQCDVFITIGIGGSYLGAKAVISALRDSFTHGQTGHPEMIFAGHQLSTRYMQDLLAYIKDKDVCINVISKSGTTLEPALAFRLLRTALEEKYGAEGARERIFVTTDAHKGALKTLSDEKGYETFVVPDDIGGRYSVLTAVGLLPIAVAGIDTDLLLRGAAAMQEESCSAYEENACYQYAATRYALYNQGKKIEILIGYEPSLQYFNEWWKQLFGESEGKDGKGLYPSSMQFTTDLHSLGQYVQEGERILFETAIVVDSDASIQIAIPEDSDNHDGLNYLAGKKLHDANQAACEGTREAHLEGGVPQIVLGVEKIDAYTMGSLIYFFEKACAVSAYALDVNPFDQPGVEAYKKKMFSLLGKK